MLLLKQICFVVFYLALAACAATTAEPGAELVELVNEPPRTTTCSYLGEISGSQGNWFTGDFTSNENLVVGARNDLRNKALELGGNTIYIQDLVHSSSTDSLGTTNVTAIGKVYKCQ